MTYPLIVYELNEVPWRVLDGYVRLRPTSHFASLCREAVQRTTVTEDSGELHPWTTWPSAHRGVYNDDHQIRFINQCIETDYPPFWEVLVEAGIRVGIFGQLQSYATFPDDPSRYAFYVPDTFAPAAKTHPERYAPFQGFNLSMTARDGGVVPSGVRLDRSTVVSVGKMLLTGLRPRTLTQLAKHLLEERREPGMRARRSVMQAPVAFDFFLDAYRRTQPDYSAFFTNHVAGMMHRYWKHTFPEDFAPQERTQTDPLKAAHIWHAMDIADAQLGVLRGLARQRQGSLLVVSSMGQEAIQRDRYLGELRIADVAKLLAAVGFEQPSLQQLAMSPDYAFRLESEEDAEALQTATAKLLSPDGQPVFSYKLASRTLNLSLRSFPSAMLAKTVVLASDDGRRELTFDQVGFDVAFRDEGTGYHQPRGIYMLAGTLAPSPDASRIEVPLASLAAAQLDWFGVRPRPHMRPASDLKGCSRSFSA